MSAARYRVAGQVRVALVTNIPAPYRVPVYAILASMAGIELKVFFCSGREPDRAWTLPPLTFAHAFLRERVFRWRGRYIHANLDVSASLQQFEPDVVVTTGFNPTHLLAWRFAATRAVPHVAMTDGTLDWEARLSWVHRSVRRMVYRRTRAFVGASDASFALYRSYGVAPPDIFKSALCADNQAYDRASRGDATRDFDFIFCGQFIARKAPTFAIEVAAGVARRLGRKIRLLMVGAGELDPDVRHAAEDNASTVDCVLPGFATQDELPRLYARARVLLFPTLGDAWGVVANEACAAGLPVMVAPTAGVAGELVKDRENGHVCELDNEKWITAAAALISDPVTWQAMSSRSREIVRPYTYARAAAGLAEAIRHATIRAASGA